jgi:hypothetical protein
VFGDLNRFIAFMHFGETYAYEEGVVRQHGVTYSLFEFVIERGKPQLKARVKVNGNKITREPIGKIKRYDVLKFALENKEYLRNVMTLIASSVQGF